VSNGSKDDNKTRRLDDDYFKKIASRAKAAPSGGDDDKTQIVGGRVEESYSNKSGDKTQIFRPNTSPTQVEGKSEIEPQLDLMSDPPTGWLVAIEGPGKGTVLTVGIGNNGVGRGDEPRVTIPFNDNEISRGQSFSIVYDPKHRRYYLLPGSGKTLVYFDEQPVLERLDIKSGMSFQVGQTTFRFVALCDESFDWQ
jgi:hypothetical protein